MAGIDHLARLDLDPFVIKRGAALAPLDKRVFQHIDVFGQNPFAQGVQQKTAAPVQSAPTEGLHQAAQQTAGQRGLKQDGALGGGNFACPQAAQSALGGVAPDRLGAGQIIGAAHGAVPGIALHFSVFAGQRGNRRNRQAVPTAGVAAPKAAGVGAEKMGLLGRHARPFAVGDARTGFEGRGLTAARQLGRRLALNRPRVEQVQVMGFAPLALVFGGGNVGFVGQAGHGVLGRETGNVIGRLHGLLNGFFRKIRGAGVATAMPHIHRDTQGLVPVALDVFQLTFAHAHAQTTAF